MDAQDQTVGIAHADCAPDAQILASLLRRSSKPPKNILMVDYEPVTGSHVGPWCAGAVLPLQTRTSETSKFALMRPAAEFSAAGFYKGSMKPRTSVLVRGSVNLCAVSAIVCRQLSSSCSVVTV